MKGFVLNRMSPLWDAPWGPPWGHVWPGLLRKKRIPDWLKKKLEKFPHTYCPWRELYYRPVAARMKNGLVEPRVIIFAKEGYHNLWGWDNAPEKSINVHDIVDVYPSPFQMPPRIAFDLYQQNETRMGGIDFALIMNDGTKLYFTFGGITDFVEFPVGYTVNDIKGYEWGIVPDVHIHHTEKVYYGPGFVWCLYNEEAKVLSKIDWKLFPFFSSNLLLDEKDKYYSPEPDSPSQR